MTHRMVAARRIWSFTMIAALAIAVQLSAGAAQGQEWLSGIKWPEPKVITPGAEPGGAPSDAVVLFDGTDLSAWRGANRWEVADGVVTISGGTATTREEFGDCQLHVEWASPEEVRGNGQGRGNSGIFLMGQYEIQVLDSFENETYFDGQAGALYKTAPPMVNASRKPGEWQTYDIIFNAPKFNDAGELLKPGFITVLHNGVLVQNHTQVLGDTVFTDAPSYTRKTAKGPISIQDHGNPVRLRNIWIREFTPMVGTIDRSLPQADQILNLYQNVVPAGEAGEGAAEETSDE